MKYRIYEQAELDPQAAEPRLVAEVGYEPDAHRIANLLNCEYQENFIGHYYVADENGNKVVDKHLPPTSEDFYRDNEIPF